MVGYEHFLLHKPESPCEMKASTHAMLESVFATAKKDLTNQKRHHTVSYWLVDLQGLEPRTNRL